ncbi:MAG: anthranilate synthase component I family protein [Methanobacteriota archaeon]|nr:MAG: anthranilate synthase component I family protein [Euryarchaeota archaeon]
MCADDRVDGRYIQEIPLNLGEREFVSLVEHQAKPLVVPLCAVLPLPAASPTEVFAHLRGERGFLLESIEGSEKIAQYSYVGFDPELVVTIGESVDVDGREPYRSIAWNPPGADPIEKIRTILQRFNFVNLNAPRFFGGMVGYFAYDLVYSLWGDLLTATNPASDIPIARFMFAKDCVVFDHVGRSMYVFSSPLLLYETDPASAYRESRAAIERTAESIQTLAGPAAGFAPALLRSDGPPLPCRNLATKAVYCDAVERVKEYIAAGDIFQGVIARTIETDVAGDPFGIYRTLRAINPSPYMYYLDFGDLQIAGASPELLVRVERRTVTTVPIAGTRPRGSTAAEDLQLGADLLGDEKERAEHTMLVDLARNDIGRVCSYDSVTVRDFMAIERFSHVQHLVSTVSGRLRPDLDALDALKSCFPAGTVSGAPKLRAMQIIETLESSRRGPYAGAVGYVGFDRNLEFAITIRTVVVRDGKAAIQVGAGIVADSVPDREWHETEMKARAMVQAIAQAEGYR